MDYKSELLYLLKRLEIGDISSFEEFIYYYLFMYKNLNKVEKMIVFKSDKENYNLNEKINDYFDVELFIVEAPINCNLFHITHKDKISENDIETLNLIKNTYSKIKFEDYKDNYCPYSISFNIKNN